MTLAPHDAFLACPERQTNGTVGNMYGCIMLIPSGLAPGFFIQNLQFRGVFGNFFF